MKKNDEKYDGAALGSLEYVDEFCRFMERFNEHFERFGPREPVVAAVGEGDLVQQAAEAGWESLRAEFCDLARGVMPPLAVLHTGELNSAEFVNLECAPIRGDSRSYEVVVGNNAQMTVSFEVRKPVAWKEGGEAIVETGQPSVEEVTRAIQVMYGWLANQDDAEMDFGVMAPTSAELR
jgi:hypothetical protein